MKFSELALRYASALYQIAEENKSQDKVFNDLRSLDQLFEKENFSEFLNSPIVKSAHKEEALAAALKDSDVCEEVKNFVLLLAKKNRLTVFHEITHALQEKVDNANGVTRGSVLSASVLSPEERSKIEDIVSKFKKKRVILSYLEDPKLIGGLVAQVGGHTFDDTLTTHLRRIKEDLNRSIH